MSINEQTPVVPEEKKEVVSPSERFMTRVIQQFASMPGGDIEMTSFQKKLIQNYFIRLDQVLKAAEVKRLKQPEDKRETLAFTWQNVNVEQLAVDVVAYASVGMDPLQPNHINLIPYKNGRTLKYDITFMLGYRGIELKAMKYGLDPLPTDIRIEIVYTNDNFVPVKKDRNNPTETYDFSQPSPFDRGEVVGGFFHFEYEDPKKNALRTFSRAQIDKRKPAYASPDFWGGERTVWKNNKPDGKEKVEGWYDEMAWKTVARAAYNSITIDSEKIDAHFIAMMQQENAAAQLPQDALDKVQGEINENAQTEDVQFFLADTGSQMSPSDLFAEEAQTAKYQKNPTKKTEPKAEDKKVDQPAETTNNDDQPPFA